MSQIPSTARTSTTPVDPVPGRLFELRRLSSLGRQPSWTWGLALLTLGLWTFGLAAFLNQWVQPAPRIHDEFSNLLSADTLLRGRLSNPTPEVWPALQSIHVVMQPSYASKYPLGIPLMTALGLKLWGTPYAGSWLSAAILVVAVSWMLAGVMPRRWALFGGLLLSLHPFVQVHWGQSLVHGLLPATGSALATGAILRLRRGSQVAAWVWLGVGVGVLALARPYEGLVATLLLLGTLAGWWYQRGCPIAGLPGGLGLVGCFVPVGMALGLTALQNQAVTGEWWRMPYVVHERQHGVAPTFVWATPKLENLSPGPEGSETVVRYHQDSLDWFGQRRGLTGWWQGLGMAWRNVWVLSLPFALLILIVGFRPQFTRVGGALVGLVVLQIACSAMGVWIYPHYLAPVLPWVILMAFLGLRQSQRLGDASTRWRWRGAVGLASLTLLVTLVQAVGTARASFDQSWIRKREAVASKLLATGERHLVLVDYAADHNVHEEWVYNLAEPDGAPIVWARYESGKWLPELLERYGVGRRVWLLAADAPGLSIVPWTNTTESIAQTEPSTGEVP